LSAMAPAPKTFLAYMSVSLCAAVIAAVKMLRAA
jgi:hypothetical protein